MESIMEHWPAIVFLLTTILSLVIAILKHFGKKKAANAIEELKNILHQTFGNVEELKAKWKESGAEEKYGHIGEIFAKINKEAELEEILNTAYKQWLEAQKKDAIGKPEEKKEEEK